MPKFSTIAPELLEDLLVACKGDQKVVEGILAWDVSQLRQALANSMQRERNAISKMLEHQEVAKMAMRGDNLHEMCDKDLTRLGAIVDAVTNALDDAGVLKLGANNAVIHPADRVSRLAETVTNLKAELSHLSQIVEKRDKQIDTLVKESAEAKADASRADNAAASFKAQVEEYKAAIESTQPYIIRAHTVLDQQGVPTDDDWGKITIDGRIERLVAIHQKQLKLTEQERDDAHNRAAEYAHDLHTVNQTVELRDKQIKELNKTVAVLKEADNWVNQLLDKAGVPLVENREGTLTIATHARVQRMIEMMDAYQQVARGSSDKRLLVLGVLDTHIALASSRSALAAVRSEIAERDADDSERTLHEALTEVYQDQVKALNNLRSLLS